MPQYKTPDHKGNLYVMLEIDMPDESWLKTIDTEVSYLSLVVQPASEAASHQQPSVLLGPRGAPSPKEG